jgi:hypothetical protein
MLLLKLVLKPCYRFSLEEPVVALYFSFCLIQGPVQGSDDPEPEPDHLNGFIDKLDEPDQTGLRHP